MSRHRVAIVGLGMALKPHLESLRELADRVDVVACHSPSQARRDAFARGNPDLPVTPELDATLADPAVDIVLLLTPPFTHRDLIARCAASGKHVLVEKPLDVSVARGRQSVRAMERAGRTLGVVLQHRFRPASRRLAALVASGKLGALLSGSASIRWWRPPDYFAQPGRGLMARDGGGVLLTQAIHTLDLFLSLTGPVGRLAAMAMTSRLRKIDTEDVVAATVAFSAGGIGSIDATTVAYPGFPERIELAYEHATAALEAETLDVYFKDGRLIHEKGEASRSGGADPMAFSNDAHKVLIENFLDAVEHGREPIVSGRAALEVQQLIEAILRASASGEVVQLD